MFCYSTIKSQNKQIRKFLEKSHFTRNSKISHTWSARYLLGRSSGNLQCRRALNSCTCPFSQNNKRGRTKNKARRRRRRPLFPSQNQQPRNKYKTRVGRLYASGKGTKHCCRTESRSRLQQAGSGAENITVKTRRFVYILFGRKTPPPSRRARKRNTHKQSPRRVRVSVCLDVVARGAACSSVDRGVCCCYCYYYCSSPPPQSELEKTTTAACSNF